MANITNSNNNSDGERYPGIYVPKRRYLEQLKEEERKKEKEKEQEESSKKIRLQQINEIEIYNDEDDYTFMDLYKKYHNIVINENFLNETQLCLNTFLNALKKNSKFNLFYCIRGIKKYDKSQYVETVPFLLDTIKQMTLDIEVWKRRTDSDHYICVCEILGNYFNKVVNFYYL